MCMNSSDSRRMDTCMINLIDALKERGMITLGCCCGHTIYPMTIVCQTPSGIIYDLISLQQIPRKRRFYRKDRGGFYYIPEVVEYWKKKRVIF